MHYMNARIESDFADNKGVPDELSLTQLSLFICTAHQGVIHQFVSSRWHCR